MFGTDSPLFPPPSVTEEEIHTAVWPSTKKVYTTLDALPANTRTKDYVWQCPCSPGNLTLLVPLDIKLITEAGPSFVVGNKLINKNYGSMLTNMFQNMHVIFGVSHRLNMLV